MSQPSNWGSGWDDYPGGEAGVRERAIAIIRGTLRNMLKRGFEGFSTDALCFFGSYISGWEYPDPDKRERDAVNREAWILLEDMACGDFQSGMCACCGELIHPDIDHDHAKDCELANLLRRTGRRTAGSPER